MSANETAVLQTNSPESKYAGGFAACVWEWDVGVCEWDLEPDPFLAVGS